MVINIVLKAIKSVNEGLNNEELNNIDENTLLFTNLDSVAVLDLIIEIEDGLQLEYGKYIQIADDTMMDEVKTPFKTLGSLISFLENKINSL